MTSIFIDEPEITEADISAVVQTMRAGQISTAHRTVEQFEECMAAFLGVSDCLATNSGTSALHLALLEAGAGPGVRVVVPALSFVATANAVKYTGADIAFIDVNLDTWMIFDQPMKVYTGDKIFLPVFLYGGKVPKFNPVLDRQGWDKNVNIVFDLAEMIGTGIRPPGTSSFEVYYCFSFNGNKTITGGAGGLVTATPGAVMSMRERVSPRTYNGLAYNYRMPSLNAALAMSQLASVHKRNARKREIAKIYKALLPEVKFQKGIENGIVWMVAGLFPEEVNIGQLQADLDLLHRIPTRRVFKPLNHYSHLKTPGQFYPNAEYIYEHGLCFPSSTRNTDEAIEYVCKTIKELAFK